MIDTKQLTSTTTLDKPTPDVTHTVRSSWLFWRL